MTISKKPWRQRTWWLISLSVALIPALSSSRAAIAVVKGQGLLVEHCKIRYVSYGEQERALGRYDHDDSAYVQKVFA